MASTSTNIGNHFLAQSDVSIHSTLGRRGLRPIGSPGSSPSRPTANNSWLRKLAHGRELYFIPTGDIAVTRPPTSQKTQTQVPSNSPSACSFYDAGPVCSDSFFGVVYGDLVLCLSCRSDQIDAPDGRSWFEAKPKAEGNFGKICQSQLSVGR